MRFRRHTRTRHRALPTVIDGDTAYPLDDEMRWPFFVYGTLRPRGSLASQWQAVARAAFDGKVVVHDFRLVFAEPHRAFPYAIPGEGSRIVGALVMPDAPFYDDILRTFDQIEGYPTHYDRVVVAVHDGEEPGLCLGAAWMYVPQRSLIAGLQLDSAVPVPGGDWYRSGAHLR